MPADPGPSGAVPAPSSGFSSGFDGTLTPGTRRAVIAVDLMRAYFDVSSPLCLPSTACLTAAAAVLASARAAGVPVVHTVVRFDDEAHGGVFLRKIPALRSLIGPVSRPVTPARATEFSMSWKSMTKGLSCWLSRCSAWPQPP